MKYIEIEKPHRYRNDSFIPSPKPFPLRSLFSREFFLCDRVQPTFERNFKSWASVAH